MLVQLVLAADAERGLVLSRGPAEVDSSLEARVDLLVDGATKDLQKTRIESDPVKKTCQLASIVKKDGHLSILQYIRVSTGNH